MKSRVPVQMTWVWLVAALLVLSCSQPSEQTSHVAAIDQEMLLVVKALDNPFFVEVQKGAEAALHGSNCVLATRGGATESDIQGQRQILEAAVATYLAQKPTKKLAGVLITPSSSGPELIEPLLRFRKAGVPVVIVDTRIDSTAMAQLEFRPTGFVGSSNRDGGRLVGEFFRDSIPGGDDILLLNGVAGHESAQARRAGFLDIIGGRGVRVTERTANWRRAEAHTIVDGLLTGRRKWRGIFAANDEMALGAAEALRQHGITNVPVVGFDATPEARAAVASHILRATVAQQPIEMGRVAVRLALGTAGADDAVGGERITPLVLVTH